jgi:hypothetical protein
MCLEWLEKNATGVLLALLIVLVFLVVWRKDSMCGGMDQGCRCCGFEPMASMRNRKVEGMTAQMHDRRVEGMYDRPAIMHDRQVEGMTGAVMHDRKVEGMQGAVMHDRRVEGMQGMYGSQASDSMVGMYGSEATETLLTRPIIYDDLLFNVQQGTV